MQKAAIYQLGADQIKLKGQKKESNFNYYYCMYWMPIFHTLYLLITTEPLANSIMARWCYSITPCSPTAHHPSMVIMEARRCKIATQTEYRQ